LQLDYHHRFLLSSSLNRAPRFGLDSNGLHTASGTSGSCDENKRSGERIFDLNQNQGGRCTRKVNVYAIAQGRENAEKIVS
jgi:hypothetical protein